mmetsp:Transcript_76265/g.177015  ORF Transcript_76265/g.177015 Transcript_76265/m.177015 type:complete len:567 (+) Transcript_76265:36-1736(+)|eukprot:CAMPEP_0171062718 /NCGR_PEP_ID=MMETSP0766_2-20121228/5201_1 /TAXON_ID=439317 /ORGANISM="Gambierdiscus australes, Strain CAWD 149" /LENGTH=566 /DNA_ID=CAMNT_0011518525 /DNA_START=35 /DNA_END=1735 /DNA_ORIENTATION=+
MAARTCPTGASVPQLPAVTEGSSDEPSTDELFRDAENAFSEIFSVQAPRDVIAGLWSALQCITSGLFLGVAGAILQPIEGMRDGGVPGCFRGVALGLCAGIFFSLTGLCTGVFQAFRGALATPRALCMISRGRQWDRKAASWVEPRAYRLPEEAARVLPDSEKDDDEDTDVSGTEPGGSAASSRRVVDTYFYDQLGVAPTASQRDIRRAYFHQSRQWHPDKTSEPQAKERFQAISEAYQVLSDPGRRLAYDSQGRQGAGEGFVDARIFFSVLLGADALEAHIGRLRLAEMFGEDCFNCKKDDDDNAAAKAGAGTMDDLHQQLRDAERLEAQQTRREVRLAVRLARRLDSSWGSSSLTVKQAADEEACRILQKDASLDRFLTEIGWVYRNRAEHYLAKQRSRFGALGFHALGLRLRGRGREARQKANTAKLAVSSFFKLRKIASEADESPAAAGVAGKEEEEMPSSVSHALPTFMEVIWSISSHDITGTLDNVIERVLSDSSVSLAVRCHRAQGLRDLGDAFVGKAEAVRLATAASSSASAGGAEQPRRRFEEALLASTNVGVRQKE